MSVGIGIDLGAASATGVAVRRRGGSLALAGWSGWSSLHPHSN